jgi:hypothetical protein
MSNHRTHVRVGAVAGGAAAAYLARHQPGPLALAETLGGGLAGALGAKIPDILEPAVHSWHRSTAHSVTVGGGAVAVAMRSVRSWQRHCRDQVAQHSRQQAESADPIVGLWHGLMVLVWSFLCGVAPGMAAGYMSHLALDACTPRGLPVIC